MKQLMSLEEALEFNATFETDIFLDQKEEMYDLLMDSDNSYKVVLQYRDLGWDKYVFSPISIKRC